MNRATVKSGSGCDEISASTIAGAGGGCCRCVRRIADRAGASLSDAPGDLDCSRRDFPAENLKELIAYAKANGDKLNMAPAGVGSIAFDFGLKFNAIVGMKPVQAPFAGIGPATNALMGGQVDYLITGVPEVGQQVVAGLLKGYAISAPEWNRRCRTSRPRRKRGCRNSRRCPGLPCLRRRAHCGPSSTAVQRPRQRIG